MGSYETPCGDWSVIDRLTRWFDKEIGTEYEINTCEEFGKYYVVFFEVYPSEFKKMEKWFEENWKEGLT